jgi:hypothetical protein
MGDHDRKNAAMPIVSSSQLSLGVRNWASIAAVILVLIAAFWRIAPQKDSSLKSSLEIFERCSLRHYNTSALELAVPIKPEEFIERRNRLARALHEEQLDAFIVECVLTLTLPRSWSKQAEYD